MTDTPSPDWAEPRRTCPYGCADYVALLDRAEKAEAEAARLREALRPFGVAALGIPPEVAGSSDGLRFARSTSAAAFRRARALTGGDHG